MDKRINQAQRTAFEHHLRLEEKPLDDKEAAAAWKEHLLVLGYAPSTINSMLIAVNRFFRFQHWDELRVKTVRVQRWIFRSRERELTKEEYVRLLEAAYVLGRERLALLMEPICATGIWVSEVQYITVEAAQAGVAPSKVFPITCVTSSHGHFTEFVGIGAAGGCAGPYFLAAIITK